MLPKQYNTCGNTADNTNCKCFFCPHTFHAQRDTARFANIFWERESSERWFSPQPPKVLITRPRWASSFMWLSWTSTVRTDGKSRITQKDRLWQQISIRNSKIWHDFPKMNLEREWTRKWVGLTYIWNYQQFIFNKTHAALPSRMFKQETII